MESGKLILVGSTVENPSFYLNKALLSRLRVLKINALDEEELKLIFDRYLDYRKKKIEPDIRDYLLQLAHGDGRYLLNLLENLESYPKKKINLNEVTKFLQEKAPLFDKDTDQHYNLISALHKSVRGSDPDAALYWFSRILLGGEEPLFVARRLIRMACEDIGLADPQALPLAIAARDNYEMLGSPEGELGLAMVVVYLALAPKSNAIYTALNKANALAQETNHLPPPMTILNAPTSLMRKMGYGEGYIYDHETPEAFSGQNYFPNGMKKAYFYFPTSYGFESELDNRLKRTKKLRRSPPKDKN